MNKFSFYDPKTTIGGMVIFVALALLWTKRVDPQTAMTIIGLAAGWIGIAAKDGNKP